MQGKNLSEICSTVMNFFNKRVKELDKTVKFVKRKSKLGAQVFAEVLISGCLSDPTISLERLCKLIKERGIKISKQGLHQRFNREASTLMENLFIDSLQQFQTEKRVMIDLLKPFSTVQLRDSSGISLPASLKNLYKGCGGSASEAGLKIQVLYDYVQGQVDEVTMTEGCRSDQGFEGHLNKIEKGTLYLQDLGYFKLKTFVTIQANEAYFISRYLYPSKLLDKNDEALDLLGELRKAEFYFAKKVRLSEKEKIEIRLIAHRLPDKEVQARIRKLKRSLEKKGKMPTQATLELAHWSLYITNVPDTMLKDEQIHWVYSLRWQIELFFKLCKSEAGIDKVSGKRSDRIVCEIYAKLICVVTLLYVCFPIRWHENQELSFYKAYKALKLRACDFFKALKSSYRLMEFIKTFLSDLEDFSLKDKYRKKRRLTYQKLMDTTGQEVLV